MEEQIANLMKYLKCSREEALEVIATDKAIDKGADPFPLSDEQKKAVRKMTQADRKKTPTAYNFNKRERKANTEKQCIINQIIKALEPNCDAPIEVANAEREITFLYSGVKYKVVLSCPRS